MKKIRRPSIIKSWFFGFAYLSSFLACLFATYLIYPGNARNVAIGIVFLIYIGVLMGEIFYLRYLLEWIAEDVPDNNVAEDRESDIQRRSYT